MTDGRFVSWDRWEAEHKALTARVDALQREVDAWQGKEDRAHTEHRARVWQGILAVVTGLVLPLATIGVVALLHLARK